MYLDIEQIEHLEELAERLESLRDELDDLSDKFKDLVLDDEFNNEDLQSVTHLLRVDALDAVEEANNILSDYLYRIEDGDHVFFEED